MQNMKEIIDDLVLHIEEKMKINVSDISEDDLLTKDKNGITLIEHLIKKNVIIYGLDNIIQNNVEIVYIFIKNNKSLKKYFISEEVLFSEINGKKIIDYITEKEELGLKTIRYIENHIEIIDYLLKKSPDLIFLLNLELLKKLLIKNDKGNYPFEKYIDKISIITKVISLIDDAQIILYILNKYKDKFFICSISGEQLLLKLPNGKTVVEQLLDQNYNFENIFITNLEVMKILYKYDRPDILKLVDDKKIFNKIEENNPQTYFDYLLECYKNKRIKIIPKSPTDIDLKVKYYISLAKHDMLEYVPKITVNELINGKKNKETLLEKLLNVDPDITLNKILDSNLKNKLSIALILNKKGYKKTDVNFNINSCFDETKTIRNEIYYLDSQTKGIGPLPKEGEQLLYQLEQLFLADLRSDKTLIKALVSGYRHGLLIDYERNLAELKKLIEIKQNNFSKFYYLKTNDSGYFSLQDESVHAKYGNVGTIIHETGHALHHFLTNNSHPNNYKKIKNEIATNDDVYCQIVSMDIMRKQESKKIYAQIEKNYSNKKKLTSKEDIEEFLSKSKKEKLKKYKKTGIPEEQLEIILDGFFTVENFEKNEKRIFISEVSSAMLNTKMTEFNAISDILDAVYEGKIHSGITSNMLTNKKISLPGHGVRYFSREDSQFNEIVANFCTLSKIDGTETLKNIIGEEAYNMISDYYYQNIIGIKKEKNKDVKK